MSVMPFLTYMHVHMPPKACLYVPAHTHTCTRAYTYKYTLSHTLAHELDVLIQGMPLPPQSGKVRMEHVVPISSKYGGLTMERLRSLFFLGLGTDCASNSGDAAHAAGRADHAPAAARSSTLDAANAPPGQGAATAGVRSSGLVPHEGLLRGSETGQGKAAGRQQGASSEEKGSGENRQGNSLSCQPALQPASHIMLAIADDDGSVSLMRLFSHIQPPFEGPEALPDAMGGEEGGADSDEDG